MADKIKIVVEYSTKVLDALGIVKYLELYYPYLCVDKPLLEGLQVIAETAYKHCTVELGIGQEHIKSVTLFSWSKEYTFKTKPLFPNSGAWTLIHTSTK